MSLSARRAWIEISVVEYFVSCVSSLSARRAWIEITPPGGLYTAKAVALRKESVDRNFIMPPVAYQSILSLSARRAWIEIAPCRPCRPRSRVALRKESVDRNPG